MNRPIFTVLFLALSPLVFAGDLVETNSDLAGLPEVLEFDCFPTSGKAAKYIEPLNRRMRVPKNFEHPPDDPSWLNWNIRIVGEDESVVARFAAIQFGEMDVGIEWIQREFTPLSQAADNGFGIDIYLRTPQPDDAAKDHWLFFLTEGKFLKVIARAEIDWNSLLTCFE